MAKITWRGEDELHNGSPGPSFTTAYGGIKFPKGEPVDISDKAIIAKARNNHFFEVSGLGGRPPRADHVEDPS